MPKYLDTSPRCTVRLYKTISRSTSDGSTPVSERYRGKSTYIDLTPLLGDGSSVHVRKSVREPAGGFVITFADKPQGSGGPSLETVYGLVEPMDVVEIRMWSGLGAPPSGGDYPIVMRGFVSDVSRAQAMSGDRPTRTVTIVGQDYGKIWQIFQVLYLPQYVEGKALLSSFALAELFGVSVVNAKPAGDFVRELIQKVINPFLAGFLPDTLPSAIPKEIQTGDSIAVKYGSVNVSYQQAQGSIYEILRRHGDVGHWNELYLEDRADGVHCVYRPIPALKLVPAENPADRKIIPDAPDPIYCEIHDSLVRGLNVSRSDSKVINFFWVNNSKFDLIDDMTRRLYAIKGNDPSINAQDYPNSSAHYYGLRPMYAETQQGDTDVKNLNSGLTPDAQSSRAPQLDSWINRRRTQLKELNKDNVVLEDGRAQIKGLPMRPDGAECMKAGDYARFVFGSLRWDAYVTAIEHEFVPYQEFITTLSFERSEGFARRIEQGSGADSPWLAEQATRLGRLY